MNLGAVTTLVFDLDGVVWRGDTPIAGAISAINDLRAAGKRCLFCTNNSAQTQADFVTKLAGMGVEGVQEEEVITSSSATALYLSAQYTGPFLAYVVGGEGIRLALQKIGARIFRDADITEETNVDCVIAGIDREFNYEKLRIAQRLIQRGALFIATNRDATYPIENGVIPGAGAVIAAIETASGSTPVTIGKPRPVMIQLVMQKYGLQADQIAVIGDRLDTDIVCARRAGVAALLVTTGVTNLQQAQRAKGEMRPDAVFPDLTTFAEIVLTNSPTAPLETDDLPTAMQSTPAAAAAIETTTAPAFELAENTVGANTVAQSTPAVAEAPQETPAFSIESVATEETPEDITSEAESPVEIELPVEAEPALALDSPAAEAPNAEEEKLEGWDDTWFAEAAESDSAASESAETTAPEPDAESNAPAADAPAADASKDDGFNWKLD